MEYGIMDIGAPALLPAILEIAESSGYSTYWATEHHSAAQSAVPLLVAALALSSTDRIRVGTAGVLVGYNNPLRVVQQTRVIQTFFSGRFRLGLASARLPALLEPQLLEGRQRPTREEIDQRTSSIVNMVRGNAPAGGAIGPQSAALPEVWLCGTTRKSAALAGELGVCFAYHRFIAQGDKDPKTDIFATYRENFQTTNGQSRPRTALAAYGACHRDRGQAEVSWRKVMGESSRACFLGEPKDCEEALRGLERTYRPDEMIVQCFSPEASDVVEAYVLLGQALRLTDDRKCDGQ